LEGPGFGKDKTQAGLLVTAGVLECL